MYASEVERVRVLWVEPLPDGVTVLIVGCTDYPAFRGLPCAVTWEDGTYGLTGWNSDRGVAYYRSDAALAQRIQ